MKKMKKIISLLLIIVSVLSFSMLAGCKDDETPAPAPTKAELENKTHNEFITELGGVSETYTGEVSGSFNTKTQAATAYVEEQVAYNKTVDVIDTVSKGDLDEQQIDSLNIPAADKAGMIGVEEIEVVYVEEEPVSGGGASGYSTFATLNTQKKVKVYIIKYQNDFKYFTPCPVNGDTLTQSYYNSVFNAEKYRNCTYNTTMTMTMDMKVSGMTIVFETIATQKMLITENAILLETTTTTSMTVPGYPVDDYTETLYGYIENEGNQIICYVSDDGEEWYPGDLVYDFSLTYDDLTPFSGEYLDCSYFKKTDFGFELSKENAQKYIGEALGEQLENNPGGLEGVGMDYAVEMFAKYYVKEGVLSGMRLELTMDMDMTVDGETADVDYLIVAETTVTNYGTTVVEQPFDNVA